MIVTIDGPAGAGKSTVARALAKRLGFRYLDTGAMYRAATLKALREKIPLDDPRALARMLHRTRIDFRRGRAGLRAILDGRDVSRAIRTPLVTREIHWLASAPPVRIWMVRRQRELVRDGDYVGEGRDLGTVVFPTAPAKFFLVADPKERARRRWRELRESGTRPRLADVLREMLLRDRRDQTRKVAPLRRAPDAVRIDSSGKTPAQVVEEMARRVPGSAGVRGRLARPISSPAAGHR